MADLKNMTGTEAFQLAKDESALTIEEIAERLTVSPSVIKRYLNAGDNYLPSLEMIPRSVQHWATISFCAGWRRKSKRRKTPSLPPKTGPRY